MYKILKNHFFNLMYDIRTDIKVFMLWRNHTKEILDMLIYRAKTLSEEAYDATLERPNASSVDSYDNSLAI